MNMVAKGRQRFRVCNAQTEADGVVLLSILYVPHNFNVQSMQGSIYT
jgi:hypothetical protein